MKFINLSKKELETLLWISIPIMIGVIIILINSYIKDVEFKAYDRGAQRIGVYTFTHKELPSRFYLEYSFFYPQATDEEIEIAAKKESKNWKEKYFNDSE